MPQHGPAVDPNDIERQVRAVMAACIAQEVHNGRTREEAAVVCYQMMREQLKDAEARLED